jgi:hypothetical protein
MGKLIKCLMKGLLKSLRKSTSFSFFESLSREALLKGRLSTVDLLAVISLDLLLFTLKILFTYVTKQAT